ncbi:hypothetical protein QTG54_015660 [Skeletonema marinoi]|uniref:MYND-type domain-containing protein n=1 Tax=Skeletonema marinoi TaxID=267567 RepID=A0AAD9D4N5_9STRA|nr:hypothetical protein QTG54_015660 [Skeletonema marinoi]
MSEDNTSNISVCAACGIAEVDEVKMKECADCDLVRYCSDECQKNHATLHKEACKKRAAELRDELLFKQPDGTHRGDCPICMIPLPLKKSIIMSCCSKLICRGCHYANQKREYEGRIEHSCLFCRKPTVATDEECDKQRMKRIEANDPAAMRQEGKELCKKGEYGSAFEYFTRAAGLGDVGAQFQLADLYRNGLGVEKDRGREIHHLEEAAIGGHPYARYNLGCHEWHNDNKERAVKHWIISANLGDDASIKALMNEFRSGIVSKDDLAAALRAHQVAVDATKSPQREAADEYYRELDSMHSC